jgi:hypothetical protein
MQARFINDCRNPCLYNVEFQKRPEEGFALVVATRGEQRVKKRPSNRRRNKTQRRRHPVRQ